MSDIELAYQEIMEAFNRQNPGMMETIQRAQEICAFYEQIMQYYPKEVILTWTTTTTGSDTAP